MVHNFNKYSLVESRMRYCVKPIYTPFLFLIDCVGGLLFFWTKLFRMPTNPKKILVIRLDHAGDMVMTTPVFRALKKRFPKAKVCVLCRPFVADVIETNKNVDVVYTLEPPWFKRGKSFGWWQTVCFLAGLRKEEFDLVFEFHGDPRNIFAAFLIGGYSIGYSVRGFGFLLNKIVFWRDGQMHMIERYVDGVRTVGADAGVKLDLKITGDDVWFAKEVCGKRKLKNFVVVYIGAGRPEKYWVVDRWAELCERIVEMDKTVKMVIAGFDTDIQVGDCIISKISPKVRNNVVGMCGEFHGFRKLAAFLTKARLVISTDTVAVHLAQALQVSCIGLYGPTNPEIWGYSGGRSVSVYKRLNDNCRVDCRKEVHRMDMMSKITVDDVLFAVSKLW